MAQILVVDDEPGFCQLLQKILVDEHHDVAVACDGAVALEFIQVGAFDLLVTDLIMPEKEGLEVILDVRKWHPNIKIIAMTGGGYGNASEYLSWAKAFGVNKTLTKPFSRDELLLAVNTALGS